MIIKHKTVDRKERLSASFKAEVDKGLDFRFNTPLTGHSVVLGERGIESEATHYVHHETGTLHEKADYTLEALPLPCDITIEGITYEVTEQPTFEFDVPGTYIIQVDAGVKFLQKEFTIDYQA